jgi:L-fuculose-phosphate aldolase
MSENGDGVVGEAAIRAEIVAYCTLLWERRLVTGSSGNVSVRLPDGDVLVTPAARSLRALDPREIVQVDASGNARDERALASSELPLHLAAYRVRPDVACVVHTHPTFCVVWSKFGEVFPRDTVGAVETLGPVGWAEYAPPGSAALAESAARVFASGVDAVLMERHGLSIAAAGLEQAFVLTDLAEEAARIAYFSKIGVPPA